MPPISPKKPKEVAPLAGDPAAVPSKPSKAEDELRPLTPAQHEAIKAAEPKARGKVVESLL